MRRMNKSQFDCMSFKFSFDVSHRQSFIFWSSILGTHRAHTFVINKCSCKIVLTEPVLIPTVSAIWCTLTRRFCITIFSTVWQFSSQTASDGRPDRGVIFKACSASTKLGRPTFDCSIWRRIFTINNDHSIVYLLRLNVLQSQKFDHRAIADFVKIRHTVLPAHF